MQPFPFPLPVLFHFKPWNMNRMVLNFIYLMGEYVYWYMQNFIWTDCCSINSVFLHFQWMLPLLFAASYIFQTTWVGKFLHRYLRCLPKHSSNLCMQNTSIVVNFSHITSVIPSNDHGCRYLSNLIGKSSCDPLTELCWFHL